MIESLNLNAAIKMTFDQTTVYPSLHTSNQSTGNGSELFRLQQFQDYEIVLVTSFLVCLVLAILIGNGLTIGIFYKYAPIRTVTNYFIVSLAISDILVAFLSIPLWIAYVHRDLFADAHGAEVSVLVHHLLCD